MSAFYIYNKEFHRWYTEDGSKITNIEDRYGYSSQSEANSAITALKLSTGTDSLNVVQR